MEQFSVQDELGVISYGISVRRLETLDEQSVDTSRADILHSAAGISYGLGSDTCISSNIPAVMENTEQAALLQTREFLEDAMTHPTLPISTARQAEDIYHNLSFIGTKELTEATRSIAEYWKTYLYNSPNASIFVVTSTTFEKEEFEADEEYGGDFNLGYVSSEKSDTYILDRVLDNFSDEELHEFRGRLLLTEAELQRQHGDSIKTILLDDWMMSGQQMQAKLDELFEHFKPVDLEINLLVSTKERLTNGINHDQTVAPVPVKSYFVSHNADHHYVFEFGGAYVTGTHSSGDYPFEGAMESIAEALNKARSPDEPPVYLPPLANIIRPYYSPNYSPRYIERLDTLRVMGQRILTEV